MTQAEMSMAIVSGLQSFAGRGTFSPTALKLEGASGRYYRLTHYFSAGRKAKRRKVRAQHEEEHEAPAQPPAQPLAQRVLVASSAPISSESVKEQARTARMHTKI